MTDTSTPTPTRPAGLRGLLPIDHEFHSQLKTPAEYGFSFPAPHYPIDKTGTVGAWGMMGNGPDSTLTVNGGQPVGDCGVAGCPGHANMIAAVATSQPVDENTLTSNQIVTLYFIYQAEMAGTDWRPSGDTWNAPSGLDNGVDLGPWLLWLTSHDLTGAEVPAGEGVIKGFVKLDLSQIDAALDLFDVVEVGVSLTPDADQVFEQGGTWDVSPSNQPDPSEGHAILKARAEGPNGPDVYLTWGAEQAATRGWSTACVQQAYGIVTTVEGRANVIAAGFPYDQLLGDIRTLGGTAAPDAPEPGPAPAPSPAPPEPAPTPPTPTPTPQEGIVDEVIAQAEAIAGEAIAAIVRLVEHLGGSIPEWTGSREA